MDDTPSTQPFTLRDVIVDALDALRADWRAHLGWNLVWLAAALCGCCGTSVAMAVVAGALGVSLDDGAGSHETARLVGQLSIAAFAVIVPLMLVLYPAHQSVTIVLTRARLRGSAVTMREAIRRGLARTPALVGHVIARTFVDLAPLTALELGIGAALWAAFGDDHSTSGVSATTWVIVAMFFVLAPLVALGTRAFVGIGYPCVVDGAGPLAALAASSRLLRGRRWQFIGLRLAVGAMWGFAYCTCWIPSYVLSAIGAAIHEPAIALVTLPVLLGLYTGVLVLFAIDAAFETSFHARVTRAIDAAALAATFE